MTDPGFYREPKRSYGAETMLVIGLLIVIVGVWLEIIAK